MLHGLKWSAIGRGASQTITWVMTLITIRILAPEDYGLIALCESVLMFVGYANELGLGASLIQSDRAERAEVAAMNSVFFLWNGALYACVFAAAPMVAAFYREPALVEVLRILGLATLILSLSVVPRSLLVRAMRFKALALTKAASGISGGAITLVLALGGMGVWSLVVGSICGAAIETVGLHLANRAGPRFGLQFRLLGPHFRFGGTVMAQRVVWLAFMRADIFVIGRLFDVRTTGLYAVGRELATLPLDRIGAAINLVIFSGFARIKNDLAQVRHFFRRGFALACLASFPVFAGISAVSDPLVRAILGAAWVGSAPVVAWMAFSGPLRLIGTIATEILNALGGVGKNLEQVTLTGVLVVLGILVGVQWGVVGLCAGWLAGYLLGTLCHLLRMLGHIAQPARAVLRLALPPAAGCAAMYLAVLAARGLLAAPLADLALGVAVGLAVYVAWALLLMRETSRSFLGALRGAVQ
jgi:teichuronic acid exporter